MKMSPVISFLVFLAFVNVVTSVRSATNIDARIVGGKNISIEDVPYQVLLTINIGRYNRICGGSIISPHHVLTAAHCLNNSKIIYVRVGATDRNSEDVTEYTTRLYIIHPDYNKKKFNFDVALVFIPEGIEIDGVRTRVVQLASEGTSLVTGSKLVVSGYGIQEEHANKTSSHVQAVIVPVVSQDECRKSYKYLTDQMFCAGFPQGGKNACQGDSGSPAVSTATGKQHGIVSFGKGCGTPGYPGVYANVADHEIREFIKLISGV